MPKEDRKTIKHQKDVNVKGIRKTKFVAVFLTQ